MLMSAEELKIIHQGMTMDLGGRFNWNNVDPCDNLSDLADQAKKNFHPIVKNHWENIVS